MVELGDKRLTSRLVTLARAPDMPWPKALPQWYDLKAAYRFFDNAKAVPEHIFAGHMVNMRPGRAAAVERLAVALTLYSMIGWRILFATRLARTESGHAPREAPCFFRPAFQAS